MVKITVIGTGNIGACIAFELAHRSLCKELVLIDIMQELAEGNALDISHAIANQTQVKAGAYKDMEGSDIVIVTAGKPRSPDTKSRLDLLSFNAGIIKNIAEGIKEHAPKSIVIMVTNPVDIMNYMMYRHTGFERSRIIGSGGELDSARFRTIVSPKPNEVEAYVMGEHGDSQIPVFSRLKQKGKFLILSKEEKETIVQQCRSSSAEVLKLKKATLFGPAYHTVNMVDAILGDKKKLMMCSAVLDGEYGHSGLSIGVPVILSRKGILKIEEWKLPQDEQKMFIDSVLSLKGYIRELYR